MDYLRYNVVSKDSSQDRQATTDDDIIADVLHDLCRLSGHKG